AAVQGVSMPLVAPVNGVLESAWGPKFIALAEEVGLPLDGTRNGPLLPAPLEAGGWSSRSVTSEEAGEWLRALLSRGNKCTDSIKGHSLKATTLDWCGKYGMTDAVQTLLGHHALKGMTMYAYMRDKLAAPLREYEHMLSADPGPEAEDRYYQAAAVTPEAEAASFLASLEGHLEDDEPKGSVAEAGAVLQSSSSSSSSSDSSSSGDEAKADWSDDFQRDLGASVKKASIEGPDMVFWKHDRTLTIHSVAAGSTGEVFTCGRKRSSEYSRITQSAFMDTRCGAVMFRRAQVRGLVLAMCKHKVDHLVGKHVDTLSKLAFVLVPPGKVPEDDAVINLLPTGATQGSIAGLKRLLFESHTLIVSALKQRIERTDDTLPVSLDVAEREDRLTGQKARLGGLTFQGEEEVAHGAYDLVFSMAQKNELVWLAPEKFGTRRAEIGAKKAGKELVIDGTGVAVKDKPAVHNCIINSELDLVMAMRRRALAYDLVGILTYDVANRYHQALVQRLQDAPPPGYARVSIAQVLRADRAAFLKLAETITTLRRSGGGALPLDVQLPNILLDPSVAYHLLPLPPGASSSSTAQERSEAHQLL
ncbi:unnamed protein product, partial [Symbiodinium sp. CCMP2456]